MTLRDALVALEKRWRALAGYEDERGESEIGHESANRLLRCSDEVAALLSAHPAVEGDAVERAFDAYCDAEPNGPVSIDAIRAALDAAWPGMVADSARLDWILRRITVDDRGVSLPCGQTEPEAATKSKAAIDKAMEASRG